MLSTTLHYDRTLIRQAVLGFWWRVVGIQGILAMGLVTFGLTNALMSGDRSWRVGALATVAAVFILFVIALYLAHYRNSIHKFEALGNPEATFTATDDMFSVASQAGTSTLPWSSVTEVWRLRSCWLLLFSRSQFSTLPLADLSPELQTHIVDRVRSAGGRIR